MWVTHVHNAAKKHGFGPITVPDRLRLQSAMEYLMTYGWAILIIAVVLGALFSLGVFNGLTSAPRAPPGSCQVLRPNGPGSTSVISLEGVCSSELPQYVALFDGVSSAVTVSKVPLFPTGTSAKSIFAWIKTSKSGGTEGIVSYQQNICLQDVQIASSSSGYFMVQFDCDDYTSNFIVNDNRWHFVGFTIPASSTSPTVYVDGGSFTGSVGSVPNTASGSSLTFSGSFGGAGQYSGQMANVQIYNISLSASEVQALYIEGIGGAPIRLQNLVAWWPLNGNATDYSGDYYSGTTTRLSYISSWTTGYTAP